MKQMVYSPTFREWENWLKENNEPAFRASQIMDWLYVKRVDSFEKMTNLSKNLRILLDKDFKFVNSKTITKQVSEDGTVKFLLGLHDGHGIETVIMNHKYGKSVCVTTQVGCRIGCTFCASTLGGLKRHLEPGEIVEQVMVSQRYLDESNDRVSSVVLMGIGEPFENYDPMMSFIRIINDKHGLNIGQRHITVSTSGVVPNIYKFADEKTQVGLAISLHAPTQEVRASLMPIARRYPLAGLLDACRYYLETTNRRITFEYALIGEKNDKEEHAHELGKLLKGMNCLVNLIPVNYVPERDFVRTSKNKIFKFKRILETYNVNTTIRREHGHDIEAACGQLRAKHHKLK